MIRWMLVVAVVVFAGCGQDKGLLSSPNARSKHTPLELGGKQTQSSSAAEVPCPPKNDELRTAGTMEERLLQYRCYGNEAGKARRRS